MKLFVIPSWYPSQSNPTGGVFTREQSKAVADLHPEVEVIVSTWGHDSSFMDHRNPKKLLNTLRWYTNTPKSAITAEGNFTEIFSPCLTWSNRLPFTDIRSLIAANRRNLRTAIDLHGKPDLIHAHVSYPGGYIAAELSKEFQIPYLITEHMSPFPFAQYLRNQTLKPEIRVAFTNAKATMAVSASLAQDIAKFDLARPVVIPNLVDETVFFPRDEALGSRFVFLTLCVMTPQKGIDHLLRTIASWAPSVDDVEFRIGGAGPKLLEYQTLSEKLGIADRIQWLGPVSRDDVAREFAQCHAYVMPSRHETFGVVFAEAIACGKPVIATRCGGPEGIVNDDNGLLIDIDNQAQLQTAMQTLLEHYDRYSPDVIRADFMSRFSRKAVVDQLMQQYERALVE